MILKGLLAFKSKWTRALSQPPLDGLSCGENDGRQELGCVAAHGIFGCDAEGSYTITRQRRTGPPFLLELIARLQTTAIVPIIDVRGYARWL